jgi:outer membrane protein TolC
MTRLLLPLLVLLAAAGCRSAYQAQREAVTADAYAAAWQQQFAALPAAPAAGSAEDPLVLDLTARLAALRQAAEAPAPATPAADPLAPWRTLAASPDLDATLAAGSDLPALLALAELRNPALRAAAAEVQASRDQFPQAAYLDTVLQQYNAFVKQLDLPTGPSGHQPMTAMRFPYPDAAALQGQLITGEVAAAAARHEAARQDLLAAVRLAAYELRYLDQAQARTAEQHQLVEQALRVAQAGTRADTAEYAMVLEAQGDVAMLANEQLSLAQQRRTVVARLNALLDRAPDAALGPLAPLAPEELASDDLAELDRFVLANRPALAADRLRLDTMTTMLAMATRMTRPDASQGASYYEDRARRSSGSTADAPAAMAGMGAAPTAAPALPPPFATQGMLSTGQAAAYGTGAAYLHEIGSRLAAMRAMLADQENMTRTDVRAMWSEYDAARRELLLQRETLLPQARQALASAQAAYRAGRADFAFAVQLKAQRALLQTALATAAAERDLLSALARLDQLAGTPLPRRPTTPAQP